MKKLFTTFLSLILTIVALGGTYLYMWAEPADADEIKFYTTGTIDVELAKKGTDSEGQVLPGVTTTRVVTVKNAGDAASVAVTFTAPAALVKGEKAAITLQVTGAENGPAWTISPNKDRNVFTCTYPGVMGAGEAHDLVVTMYMEPNLDRDDDKLCWVNEDRTRTPIHGYNPKKDSLLTVKAVASELNSSQGNQQ